MLGSFEAHPASFVQAPARGGPRLRGVGAGVSIFAVDKVCRRVVIDPAFGGRASLGPRRRAALRAPRRSATGERELLLAGDVGALGRMGANFFLLHQLGRFELLGLTLALYAQRIRASTRRALAAGAAEQEGE